MTCFSVPTSVRIEKSSANCGRNLLTDKSTPGGRAMMNIPRCGTLPLSDILDQTPVEELEQSMHGFLEPLMQLLPDERLLRVVPKAVRGILAQETPVIAAMAQSTPRQESSCWAVAKRIYRFVHNERFNHHQLFKGLYRIPQRTVPPRPDRFCKQDQRRQN
jgi:hypothetical protein